MYQIKCDQCGKAVPCDPYDLPADWIAFHTTKTKQIQVCDWICLADFAKEMMIDPDFPPALLRTPEYEA